MREKKGSSDQRWRVVDTIGNRSPRETMEIKGRGKVRDTVEFRAQGVKRMGKEKNAVKKVLRSQGDRSRRRQGDGLRNRYRKEKRGETEKKCIRDMEKRKRALC